MAQLNPVKFLRKAASNSPWLVIAVALHAVVIAVMSVIYLAGGREKAVEVDTNIALAAPRPVDVVQPPEEIIRKAPPKNEEAEIVEFEREMQYIPTDTEVPEDLTQEVGNPDSESSSDGASGGTAIGAGIADGHHGTGTPSTFSTRRAGNSSVGGPKGVPSQGPTQGTEAAVRDGLIWLIRHQQDDGSWSASALPAICVNEKKCIGEDELRPESKHYQQGLTGLALLAFLGAGYNFDSKQKIRDTVQAEMFVIGDVIKDGLKWIKDCQQEDGSFGPDQNVYNHALCALALTEAYGLSKNRQWRDPAQKAIDWLVNAQKTNPETGDRWGWRYHSRADVQVLKDKYDERKAAVDVKMAPLEAKMDELDAKRTDLEARREDLKPAEYEAELKKIDLEKKEIELAIRELLPELNQVEAGIAAMTHELGDADLSVTTWVIMAFKSAEASGLKVPAEAYMGGKEFALAVSAEDGRAGYLNRTMAGQEIGGPGSEHFKYHVATMSALAMLCRTFIDHDIEDPFLELAAKHLVKDLPEASKDNATLDYYYWYYGSLALNQLDGPDSPQRSGRYWKPWNEAMQEAVLGTQDATEKACTRGGWVTGDRWALNGGPVYTTAINVLTLEVYYRYENAFGAGQRFAVAQSKSESKSEPKTAPEPKPDPNSAPEPDPDPKSELDAPK